MAEAEEEEEEVFYEGSGSNAELIVSCVLGLTLIYMPLTLQSIGRRIWIKYRFTNKRLTVETDSPITKRVVEFTWDKVREVRTQSRGFGLWGDMVVFLKDGARLELVGVERHNDLKAYIQERIAAAA